MELLANVTTRMRKSYVKEEEEEDGRTCIGGINREQLEWLASIKSQEIIDGLAISQ